MSINTTTTIQELLDLGIMTEDQYTKLRARSARQMERAAARQLVQSTADAIMAFLETDTESKYFSVKKTSNSVGFMDHVEAERGTVLKALSLLVSQDKLAKIGLVGGVEKSASDVNAFQIRYTRSLEFYVES